MKTMEEVNPSEISFTERAAMRTQCRKLAKFMKVKQERDAYFGPHQDVVVTNRFENVAYSRGANESAETSTFPCFSGVNVPRGY